MESIASQEAFIHVRMIIGVVTGLSMARLLSGLARFVQHPARPRVYPTHVIWAVFMLLATTNFWWWEPRIGWRLSKASTIRGWEDQRRLRNIFSDLPE